jgi:hypothetical protein
MSVFGGGTNDGLVNAHHKLNLLLPPVPGRELIAQTPVSPTLTKSQQFFYCALAVETLYPRVGIVPTIRTFFSLKRLMVQLIHNISTA